MERDKLFVSEGANTAATIWNSCSFGMEMQANELSCGPEKLANCFLNPNWDNSLDQSDPFESALSSIVSSPVASGANANASAIPNAGVGGDSFMIRELIGRLGNICNSGDISPQSFVNNNNNSTNTSCYSTPMNSPPKLNLSMMDSQMRGNLPIPGNSVVKHPGLAPFPADFVERAARYSCFGSNNPGGINKQFGLNESELINRLMPRVEPGKLSRVSSNNSMKVTVSQANVQESNKSSPQDGSLNSEKKFSRQSRPTTSENGDSREESSVSEQVPGGKLSMKSQNDANSRKRKSIPRGKAKETPSSSPSASDVKVAAENDESKAKRSKSDETNGSDKDTSKDKEEENGNQKQNKNNSKPPEPPKDYIHVRARRGQATDSHSLAERVRREKISERMKFLQDLVPGCNKVTGKAVMLDEIINYVQSLQRQVEFLSMKLSSVNPRMEFNMETLLSKDIFQSRGSMPHSLYPLDASTPVFPYGYQSQQGLALQNGMPSNAETQFSMNPLNAALRRNPSMHLPHLDGFGDPAALQASAMWEDDLQSVVQMGYGQNHQESFQGSVPSTHMKIEL